MNALIYKPHAEKETAPTPLDLSHANASLDTGLEKTALSVLVSKHLVNFFVYIYYFSLIGFLKCLFEFANAVVW